MVTEGCFSFSCSGFEGLVKKLMSELPDDVVTYNRPVRCVHWNDTERGENQVAVECRDGEKMLADHVIVTVPLGNFKIYLNKSNNSQIVYLF